MQTFSEVGTLTLYIRMSRIDINSPTGHYTSVSHHHHQSYIQSDKRKNVELRKHWDKRGLKSLNETYVVDIIGLYSSVGLLKHACVCVSVRKCVCVCVEKRTVVTGTVMFDVVHT